MLLPNLAIHAWTEEHVHLWMEQMFGGEAGCEMLLYADMFKKNHITGKRLLLLTEADMRDMGVTSKGHIIHLKTEIEKLANDYLGLFHFPPLVKDEWAQEEEEERIKIVNLELVFGYHWKAGSGHSDCKWKMYMELDGDEVAVTYIKDVTFNFYRSDVDVLKMTKPPFVMDRWVIGLSNNQTVDCTVNYENDVKSPKCTKHSHAVRWSSTGGMDIIKTVELVIDTGPQKTEGNPRSRSNSGVDPKWIHRLRMKQLRNQDLKSKQLAIVTPPASSSTLTLPQFLSAYGNQSSYAAAVRRSPNHSPLSPWRSDSRCSSPTAGLSSRLSTLQLGSKGSSPSSTTSESASERERPLSASALYRPKNPYFDMSLGSPQAKDARKSPTTVGHSQGQKAARNAQCGWRPRSNSSVGALCQPQPKTIPGMSPRRDPKEEPEGAKVNDGGWIKVERPKKPQRQPESRPARGRGRRGGRGGGRGRN
ncbi:hypothetical protein ACEWY4_023448 [Coilia grayii]|uniref:SAM domain-containing protein n=1 Tax=Coilia grayii TaxID=363190 RepID=A0ABD1J4Y7_9TELE